MTTLMALAFLALVVVLMFFTPDGRTAIVMGVIWFAVVVIGFFVQRGETARTKHGASVAHFDSDC